jgi:hypothetical protein
VRLIAREPNPFLSLSPLVPQSSPSLLGVAGCLFVFDVSPTCEQRTADMSSIPRDISQVPRQRKQSSCDGEENAWGNEESTRRRNGIYLRHNIVNAGVLLPALKRQARVQSPSDSDHWILASAGDRKIASSHGGSDRGELVTIEDIGKTEWARPLIHYLNHDCVSTEDHPLPPASIMHSDEPLVRVP